jgi:hypothetical protein
MATVIAVGIIFAAAPAVSGAVKTGYSEEKLLDFARKLDLLPLTSEPERGQFDVTLEVAKGVDKRVKSLGKACKGSVASSTTVAPLIERFASRWDVDGNLGTKRAGSPELSLRLTSSFSTQRCVETGEFEKSCYVRTLVKGEMELRDNSGRPMVIPVDSDVERQVPYGTYCLSSPIRNSDAGESAVLLYALFNNNDKGGIAVVNREAAISLINRAQRKLNNLPM